MRGFRRQLDEINAVADRSPGFVWRLQTDDGDATSIQLFDEPRMIVNMSVWESIESLYDYVYRSEHLRVFRDRKKWFEEMEGPHAVLWWIPAGTTPDVTEITKKLAMVERDGPAPDAFTLRHLFGPDGAPRPLPERKAR